MAHYIEVYKRHEENRTSTNERNKYWRRWQEQQNYTPKSLTRFEHGQRREKMNWIKNRLKERTTLDGVVLVASGVAMILVPVNLIAYAMIVYGAWTIWKSEQYVGNS